MDQGQNLGQNLAPVIGEHPFMKGLPPDVLSLLAGCAAEETIMAGHHLFHEGGAADKFYLIRQGAIAIEIRAPARPAIMLETLHDGDVVGWSWLIAPHKWAFDARALSLTRLISLDAQTLRRKMDEDSALGYAILGRFLPVIAHRLGATRVQLLDLYGPPKGGRG